MIKCDKCKSLRILSISAKCSDCFTADLVNTEIPTYDGSVLTGIGISNDSDFVHMKYCLDCGKIQGRFPIDMSLAFVGDDSEDEK